MGVGVWGYRGLRVLVLVFSFCTTQSAVIEDPILLDWMDRLQTSCGNPSIMDFMLLAISSFVKSSSLASKAHNAGRTVLWYEQCLLHSSSLVYAPRSHLHWAHVAHPEQLRVTRSRANTQRSRHEVQRQKHHFRGISESCPEDKQEKTPYNLHPEQVQS